MLVGARSADARDIVDVAAGISPRFLLRDTIRLWLNVGGVELLFDVVAVFVHGWQLGHDERVYQGHPVGLDTHFDVCCRDEFFFGWHGF